MPRAKNGRGGRRQGRPGQAYSNRSDLNPTQPVRAVSGQEYGQRQQQEQAQQAIPLPATPPAGPPGGAAPSPAGPLPGEMGDLLRPTDRPNEPMTAGLPFGAGPGPEVLGGPPNIDDPLELLRGLFLAYPLDELRELIDMAESQGSNAAPIQPSTGPPIGPPT